LLSDQQISEQHPFRRPAYKHQIISTNLGFVSQVRVPADLVRDVIKADSAAVLVPELDMELGIGTLGGLVTTVEVRGSAVPAAVCAAPCAALHM